MILNYGSYSYIGGADGPTSIFLAGKIGSFGWINVFGLIIVVLLLLPNIIYAVSHKGTNLKSGNRVLHILEQAGRYASMLLMIFNIGILGAGFSSLSVFFVYGAGNIVLLLAYWLVWMLYFIRPSFWKSMLLAGIPAAIFVLNAITMRHWLLLLSGLVFGITHCWITYAAHAADAS